MDQLNTMMSETDINDKVSEFFDAIFYTEAHAFRSAFMALPDNLQKEVRIEWDGTIHLRGMSSKDRSLGNPGEIELPKRLPKFDAQDYAKFYQKVSQLQDHDAVVSWLVKYINLYFCIIADPHEIIEFVYGEVDDPIRKLSPVMREEKKKADRPVQFLRRKPAEIKLRFRKCVFHDKNGKQGNLYDAWSRSLENKEYSSKVFDPTMDVAFDDPDILNTFVGLKAEQGVVFDRHNTSFHNVHAADFDILLLHIYNLCGGNKMYYEYLLDWLAYPIQTGEKTNVAVISYGGQGTGKTKFFVDFIGEQIYGEQLHAKIAGGKQIGGDFNAHISGKMFLAVEEPNDFSKAKLNILKDLITTNKAEVNSKGKDQIFADDYTNYVFTCNKIPEDMLEEDDRRYFIIQHNGEKVGDTQFFQDLVFCMETQAHEFYKFLKTREIKHFVFGQKPPQTEVKKRLLTMNIDPAFKYLQHLAETNVLAMYYKRPSDGSPVLPFKAFFDNAVDWCVQNGEEVSWAKKPKEFRELLQTKLGDDVACFEPTKVRMSDTMTGVEKIDRCVLFPKTADALTDLLVKKRVFTDLHIDADDDTLADLTDFEDQPDVVNFDEEAKKAELVELDAMIKRHQLEHGDVFDQE